MNEIVKKPWGSYQLILKEADCWIKKIVVNPGQRLSLQYHIHRFENWFVISGSGYATVNEVIKLVSKGTNININIAETHRITNNSTKPLIFIEIADGDYLEEDDIIRLDDDYGRVKHDDTK